MPIVLILRVVQAKRVAQDHEKARIEGREALDRLGDLEASLGDALVKQLAEDSASRTGEQYRPQADKITCESPV
jgi:predicted ArsR family transcriptional regulator